MTINRTTLLDLPLPVTGTESGTWGDVTNNGLAQYVDIAVAGMNNLTSANFSSGALTISNTLGTSAATNIAAGSAQYATIKVSSLAQNSTITAPASNRSYRIVNLDSTYNLTIKASGQTGITFLPGQTGVVAFTGTDYEVVGVVNAASSTDNAVPKFDGTTGQIIQNTGVTIDDSNNVSGVAQLNATTADLTNIEVTNIKAKDGTSAGSIADSTGVVTLASSVLTTTDINGGTIDGAVIGGSSAAAGSFTSLNTSGQVVFNDAGADVDFRVEGDTDANLLFVDASTDRVGVKTNAPSSDLHINPAADDIFTNGLRVQRAAATTQNVVLNYSGGAANIVATDAALSNPIIRFFTSTDGTTSTERMRIDSSGNVGIGTSSPATKFHVSNTSGATQVRVSSDTDVSFSATATGADSTAFMTVLNDARQWTIRVNGSESDQFQIRDSTAGATRMVIDSSGNVVLGSSANGGQAMTTLQGYSPNSANGSYGNLLFSANANYTGGASRFLLTNAFNVTDFAIISSVDATTTPTLDSGGAVSSGTVVFSLKAGGNAAFLGNIGIGGATPSSSGAGITFPATQSASSDANTLDDYEEGNWTPVISDGTNNATMSVSAQGRYTKIGNLVTVTGYAVTTALGSVSGNVRITGLPFTGAVGVGNYVSGCVGYAEGLNISANQVVGMYVSETNYIVLTLCDSTAGTTNLQASEWSADGGIFIALTYRT
jgi:hypothetical protein